MFQHHGLLATLIAGRSGANVFLVDQNTEAGGSLLSLNLSINEIGFNNTANIFSISESGKLGGKLGEKKDNWL